MGLRSLKLDKERNKEPWKVITSTTIDEFPVRPTKKLYAISGLILGLFASYIGNYFYEKKKGLIYNEDQIKKILEIKEVCTISNKQLPNDSENLFLFIDLFLKQNKKNKLSIIYAGEENKEYTDFIIKAISSSYKKENIFFTNNFINGFENENQILICFCGKNKIETLYELKTKIQLTRKKPSGLLIVKDY